MFALAIRRPFSLQQSLNLAKSAMSGNKVYQFQNDADIDKSKMTEFHVHRYMPGETPYVQSYWINPDECGPMYLDALIHIKNKIDSTLTMRRSCREGICGSCAMHINGTNTLACTQQFKRDSTSTVGPLPRMPVQKDLVVDLSNFYNQYKSVKPWLMRKTPKPEGAKEHIQSMEERKKLEGLIECILCSCCSTLCPSYWWNNQQYLGPAVLMQAYRWVVDSRDEYTDERLAALAGPHKLKKCYSIGACTVTCPKGLNPRDALAHLKDLAADYEERVDAWEA